MYKLNTVGNNGLLEDKVVSKCRVCFAYMVIVDGVQQSSIRVNLYYTSGVRGFNNSFLQITDFSSVREQVVMYCGEVKVQQHQRKIS